MKKKLLLLLLILFNICFFNISINGAQETKYFAIGDFSISHDNSYIERFQNDEIKATNFTKNSITGLRLEDLVYLLDETVERDDYANYILEDLNKENILNSIIDSDYVSLSFNNMDFSNYQMTSLAPFEIDLGKYLTEEQLSELEELYNQNSNASQGMGGMEESMTTAMESFLYNYLGTKYYINLLVDKILELSPNATIIFVDIYNPYDDIYLEFEGQRYSIGEMYDLTIQFADSFVDFDEAYLSKIVSVNLGNVETVFDREIIDSGVTPNAIQIMNAIMRNPERSLPSDNGHSYIKEIIINRLNNLCHHEANPDDGDCTTAVLCILCGIIMIDANEEHTVTVLEGSNSTCKDYGLTEGAYCSVCGKVLKLREQLDKLPHTYSSDCDDRCNVCNEKRTASEHSFGEWETVKEATKKEEGKEERTCSLCGHVDTKTIPVKKGCGKGSVVVFFSMVFTTVGSIYILLKRK